MAVQFSVPSEVCAKVISVFRRHGLAASGAELVHGRTALDRDSVSAEDFDFLHFAGMVGDRAVAPAAMQLLQERGLVSTEDRNNGAFEEFRRQVQNSFIVPWSSMSRAMERLLYMLAAGRKPKSILGIGTYCGYTLSWLVGPCVADRIVTLDIDEEAIELSKDNFGRLGVDLVEHRCQDVFEFLDRTDERFDLVYLDADSPDEGKRIYLPIARALVDRLNPGGWLLAHDTTNPAFRAQLEDYLAYVRTPGPFLESIEFGIDPSGLELSVMGR